MSKVRTSAVAFVLSVAVTLLGVGATFEERPPSETTVHHLSTTPAVLLPLEVRALTLDFTPGEWEYIRWASAEEQAKIDRFFADIKQQQIDAFLASLTPPPPPPYRSGQCGGRGPGSLPPCSNMKIESHSKAYPNGGDPRIWNGGCYAPVGWTRSSPCGTSSASGKWQFIRSTWNWFCGVRNAADASEKCQDDKARQLWADGRGRSHWAASS